MDRALYVAMTGARETQRQQAINNHNLANASTTGFRAELLASTAQAVQGPGLPTRVNAAAQSAGWDSRAGSIQQTGRNLDVAFGQDRSEEHTSELQSLMRISYAVFCLKKKNTRLITNSNSLPLLSHDHHT